ncbi:phosphoglycerate dehydrogenase-like enzyme [Nonomuraea thailandensis]|uniref:Phosphoglycerate dehydrogenase-like enzyme n=1 Tax=Nonomuraea thailandensis TaxID=1188745 RepID=A0A9X2GP45_9ACTN|nr:hydroxyacid dehydrogenase [Nonomuraea thailandensis]MCP2358233.1 phosphoglycerate dehydrogenase-like enzyme [Nonomuraea thailandensis]
MTHALLAMNPVHRDPLFGPAEIARLTSLVTVDPALVVQDFTDISLEQVEVLITSWGCPPIDRRVLDRAPRLRAVVHVAGSVKHHITDACWERGIAVSSTAADNAIPVAEYTVAAILFAGKRVLPIADLYRRHQAVPDWTAAFPDLGNYRRTVGIVGASAIGRRVMHLLRRFDLDVLVADPYLHTGTAEAALVTLEDLLERSDIVSLHAPELPETRHLLNRERLARMRNSATLINTARGSLVDLDALTAELVSGRLHAVIDVTDPEPLPPGHPLYDLPNVLLTPHIAGSIGGELRRLTRTALDELERFTQGRPFAHPVNPALLHRSA